MDHHNMTRAQIEVARWYLLVALDFGRPRSVAEDILLRAIDDAGIRMTIHELRRELDYLEGRKLVTVEDRDTGHWRAELTSAGVDLVEYTVDCRPGIARPPRR